MTWRRPAGILLLSVGIMAITARPPEAGIVFRLSFVASALVGAWAAWRLSRATDLSLRYVLALAVVCRLIVFPMVPGLSDDGYRYIWDGMLLAQYGISPYAFIPSDPILAGLQGNGLYSVLNSPGYFSVYPPVSQAVFAFGGLFIDSGWQASWYAIKVVFLILEAVGIACLARLVPPNGVVLYALHPVAIIEIAGQGHTEGALVGFLGVALWWIARRPGWAGIALAAAGWAKLFPLALGIFLRGHSRSLVGWGLVVGSGALLLIPGDGWSHMRESIALYGGTLDFYAAPFLMIKSLLYPFGGEMAGPLAATLLSLTWGTLLVGLFLTYEGTTVSFLRVMALAIYGYAMLSPMQHPWNWVGALFVLPLLDRQLSLFWLVSLSLPTYLRYVGWESIYLATIVVGWGGAAALWWMYKRDDNQSFGPYAEPTAERISSGVADSASIQR